MSASGRKRGPPTLYKPEYAVLAEKYCLLGATNEQLAEFFGVNPDTIYEWQKAQPEFRHAIRRGKDEADARVAESLFKRANGYTHKAVKFFVIDGKIVGQDYDEHYAPDTAAMIFWLKNRAPAKWRDKQDLEHSGAVQIVPVLNITPSKD